jgi:hypothetical protein
MSEHEHDPLDLEALDTDSLLGALAAVEKVSAEAEGGVKAGLCGIRASCRLPAQLYALRAGSGPRVWSVGVRM